MYFSFHTLTAKKSVRFSPTIHRVVEGINEGPSQKFDHVVGLLSAPVSV
jgi:hypothetical protein